MSTTMPGARLPIVVPITSPSSLYDSISSSGIAYTWPNGTTITFSLRPLVSRTPIITNATAVVMTPPDLNGNNVRYDWTPNDIIAAGEGHFYGWWTFTLPGAAPIDTPEFGIVFSDHGPGLGTQTGAIVDGASSYMPVTYSALQRDSRFGDRFLQQRAELVKWKVLGYTIPADQEVTLQIVLLDFLSKRTALELISPAIDYWSRQMRTATSTQTSEVTSFPDMIASLATLKEHLVASLSEDWDQVKLLVPGIVSHTVVHLPASTLSGVPPVTRDPQWTQGLRTGLGYGDVFEFGLFP